MLVQNECSFDWQRDSIEINIPRFELDFELGETNACDKPFWAWFENTTTVRHRLISKSWFWKRSGVSVIVPLNVIDSNIDSSLIQANFGTTTDPYDIFLVACDEYRCDTLRKDAIFESFTEPAPFFWISTEQQSDKVYLLEARHARETILVEWFFDDGTPILSLIHISEPTRPY